MDNIYDMMVPSILVEPYPYDPFEHFQQSIVNEFIKVIKEDYSLSFYPFKRLHMIVFKQRSNKCKKKKTHVEPHFGPQVLGTKLLKGEGVLCT